MQVSCMKQIHAWYFMNRALTGEHAHSGPFHAYSRHNLCMILVNIMPIIYAQFMHVSCTVHACIMHNSCMYHAQFLHGHAHRFMHIPCMVESYIQ